VSEIKYTSDGKKVTVIGKLNSQEHIVQEIFVIDGQEVPSGENFVVSSLHDAPAESWKEKNLRELEERYEKEKASIERESKDVHARHAVAKSKARLQADALASFAKNSDEEQLQRLFDFLAGDITHFVISQYGAPKIVTWDSDDMYQIDTYWRKDVQAIKLVSLYGTSKGDLQFRLGRYSDGSGGSQEIIPFRSYEDALNEVQRMCDHRAAKYVSGEQSNFYPEEWQKIDGIVIPEDAMTKYAEAAEKLRAQKIEKLRAELAILEAKTDGSRR